MNSAIDENFKQAHGVEQRELLQAEADQFLATYGTSFQPLGTQGTDRYWKHFSDSYHALLEEAAAKDKEKEADDPSFATKEVDHREELIRENGRLLRGEYREIKAVRRFWKDLPSATDKSGILKPRIVLLATAFLEATNDDGTKESWSFFIKEIEEREALLGEEIWSLVSVLKVALLERFMFHAGSETDTHLQHTEGSQLHRMGRCLKSMERLGQLDWPRYLGTLIGYEAVLRQDPSGTYPAMEQDSREHYQKAVAEIAHRADFSEIQVAKAALELARNAPEDNSPAAFRLRHIGYYIVGAGRPQLLKAVGYHPRISQRLEAFIRKQADYFYIGGIILVTEFLLAAIILPHINRHASMTGLVFGMLLMILPASQTATDLLNNLVTLLFPARALPKWDFSKGVPAECATLVAVPTLLTSVAQVERLAEEIEVRYLANRDPNIHFALLTDLPDSLTQPAEKDRSPLVDYAVSLIEKLNERYAKDQHGTFMLLHRHRIFDVRQGVWMGWERKRGKLLDLNKLICGEHDAFPVKSMALNDLRNIRYVITLDSDTQLPRGAAHRLIGTMAHPLNRAVVDPKDKIVRQGYGILQPRVDVSVHSANHSRLASLQSGESGMDPYSRAVSDVYQDLYGEAIFTGKGIYDVAVLHEILDKRFPRGALLSHDLIEGAYARVGLVSDVEVIDDYPSHYSAWTRRRHRWVRGDWQIVQWLFDRVPNEENRMVNNPISNTSRWKILDNLRRSLVETSTFVLLLVGLFALPTERVFWTACVLGLLFLSAYMQLVLALSIALWKRNWKAIGKAFSASLSAQAVVLISLAFLPSQVLTTVDAIVRSMFRRFVSGEKLLEWETAEQAESGTSTAASDTYLKLTPVLALVLAILLVLQSRHGLWICLPILALWMFTGPLMRWLDGRPSTKFILSSPQEKFLRHVALRTWRYFAEFSTADNHWLIPDNVQEGDLRQADRISPTNVGLLLNARQAALTFGYLTLPEFTSLTLKTLDSFARMPKHLGHIFNFHDTSTLAVMDPPMVTTVDSVNPCASLISLRMGALDQLKQPLVSRVLQNGLRDCQGVLESMNASTSARLFALREDEDELDAMEHLSQLSRSVHLSKEEERDSDTAWWTRQVDERLHAAQSYLNRYMPWLLAKYAPLRRSTLKAFDAAMRSVTLTNITSLIDQIEADLKRLKATSAGEEQTASLAVDLLAQIAEARVEVASLNAELERIAEQAQDLLLAMDFCHLQSPDRELLSIGFTPKEDALDSSCFDLLASEARMAVFVAIAKGDIPQQTWFRLGRNQVRAFGRSVLLSWTGTMFEYLMPTLWMESYPNTMLWRSLHNIVCVQEEYAKRRRIPWGISESGYSQTDPWGNYLYHAFGVPLVALKYGAEAGPVISPYSTCLALEFEPEAALRNLSRMQKMGWLGSYGFYEAADYSSASASRRHPDCVLVKSWMVHHQGMSLMAICNLLNDRVFQRAFHAAPMVRATERLLHERPQIGQDEQN